MKLSNCREIRRQIIWDEENGNGDDQERGVYGVGQRFELGRGTRKLSCLSPIVECVGGRDSALGTSQSGTVSGLGTNQSGRVSELRTSQLVTLSGSHESFSKSRTVSANNTTQSETGSHESKTEIVPLLKTCQSARASDEDSQR